MDMDASNMQAQISELNRKMDLVLENVNQQRLKSEAVEDLISDFSIVGKDMFDSSVNELENQQVEFDLEEIKILTIKLIKNIKNISSVVTMLESATDFAKDAAPIANEMIIDLSKQLRYFDEKGYFEFFAAFGKVIDNVVTNYTAKDVEQLAKNVPNILNTLNKLSQPEVLDTVNNAVDVYTAMDKENIPKYSIFKLMREMGKPEMKKTMGFMVTFIKEIANNNNN
jgi:uncharacterized protein YjgD (DUF1641 family)